MVLTISELRLIKPKRYYVGTLAAASRRSGRLGTGLKWGLLGTQRSDCGLPLHPGTRRQCLRWVEFDIRGKSEGLDGHRSEVCLCVYGEGCVCFPPCSQTYPLWEGLWKRLCPGWEFPLLAPNSLSKNPTDFLSFLLPWK